MRKHSVLASRVCSSLRTSPRESASEVACTTGNGRCGTEDGDETPADKPFGRRAKRARKRQNRAGSNIEYFANGPDGSIRPNAKGSKRMKTRAIEITNMDTPSGKSIE